MSRVVVVGFRVLSESTEEIPVMVELVASADGPDVGIVRLGAIAVVIDIRESSAVEVTVGSTEAELVRTVVELNALIVSSIIILRCILNVVVCVLKIPTASFERRLEVFTEVDLSTGKSSSTRPSSATEYSGILPSLTLKLPYWPSA